MQAVSPVLSEDGGSQATLTIHMQAIERAIQVMHTHLHEPLTLADLASAAYLSPFHFNRVFRRLIGVPPGEFLSALRFQTARRLLLTTPLSVTDICFEVGYTSTGSFTSRFTQLVGLSPRILRQRAHAFEPSSVTAPEPDSPSLSRIPLKSTLLGLVRAPTSFCGTIYVGLFTSPIPQGAPVRCTRLSAPGVYRINGIPDGVYYLRTAAFPSASNLQAALLPDGKLLVGSGAGLLLVRNGHIIGDPDLTLHPPLLTDPPLVMGLPLL